MTEPAFAALAAQIAALHDGPGHVAAAGHRDLGPDLWLSTDPDGRAVLSCQPSDAGFLLRLENGDSGAWAGLGLRLDLGLLAGGRYLGLLIGANAIAFVVAALLVFAFPPASPLLFYGLHGLLLGREYFTLAAMRRVGRSRAIALRKQHRGTIWIAGVLMTLPLSVPLLNLLIPILGAATFTHIFHALNERR